ncbi:uncharacterized protein tasor2 [Halichoeres trimaculatus]|uniref:uncharacterized protein tasor2 n=1 Tax=Halichoeres trimaculatus TaxID=147232 RepID=UPI003D9F3008
MESGNGGASSKGVLVPVPDNSDEFQSSIVAPLKSAYLYKDSKQSFKYNSAFLVKNPALENKYNAFRAKKKAAGYSEEDLRESFGFLLFDDVNKANTLGESGVLAGNSSCTTLGDPSNGVYLSIYSDCLDINRWYHGKSGYIAIIKLTKGRVKKVSENYTQDFTAPTAGFDCHVSDQLPSVSDKTSSFLAFERTQYYTYELLDDGSNKTAQSPSAACPYAIVSFSYTDTKAAHVAPQEDREEKKQIHHYFTWRGQLQICDQFYDIRLRSSSGALIPAQLPPVLKTDRAISISNLRQMLPKAVFETCFSGEVFQDSLWCSICEFVSSEVEQTDSLSLLLSEIKEKDVAFTVLLNDGGFLFLVHSSHFLTYDDTGSSVTEVLRGVFVFPDSRVVQRDTKFGGNKPQESSEILQVLPVLSYAEGEVEKAPIDPSEDLSEILTQHMQSYAALINPGLDIIPSREVSIFADQYDVPDAHKHLYTSPEWTERAWQSLKSYLSKPVSFQLPLAKALEILMAGHENRVEDLDDDVYICLSSPEQAPDDTAAICSEDQLEGQTSMNTETPEDGGVEAPLDLRSVSLNVEPADLQADKDSKKSEQSEAIRSNVMRTNDLLIPSTSDELPAELIVSITSAERTHDSVICNESATKQNDVQISAKSHTATVNPLNDETVESKKTLDSYEVNSLKTICRKAQRGRSKQLKKVPNSSVETHILQTEQTPVQDENSESHEDNLTKEPEDHQWQSNPPSVDWRKVRRRKRIFGKLSPRSKKMKHFTVGPVSQYPEEKKDSEKQKLESTFLKELEASPLRRKTERWDLKPVVSTCGRILIPHGSVLVADKIKSLQDQLQSARNETCQEKMLEDNDTVEMVQKLNSAQETEVDKTEDASFVERENPLNNVSVSHVSPDHSFLKLSDGSCDLSNAESDQAKNDVTNTSPYQEVQEKHSDPLALGKCSTKGELLLSKLKSVLLRGKRKMDLLGSEETACGTDKATEFHPKRSSVVSETSIVTSNDKVTSVEAASLGLKEVSKMLSVDPLFAYALGLTPKALPEMVQKTDGLGIHQKKDSSWTQEETMLDKEPKIIQRPPSIFPRKGRIKTLKKHQDVSAENVKKKWWLHFQTPASFASDNLNNKECARNNSVRKPVKERLSSACPSTDALTLLADLALSASQDKVPTQPDSALGRQPKTSLKKCDLTKDVTSVDQESVLHALLRQPAVRAAQPVKSPSPSHHVGGSELVDLISREHDYSLPPSSSLPLDLPGTPLQVSPLSGSAGLLHHQKTIYDDGSAPQHLYVVQKDGVEQNSGAPVYEKKHTMRRRKFRHSRTFTSKDSSIQVTKQWKENYDFSLDSKFASDPKDKAIVRALHGPWDHSVQDTNEEVRLIVHMWIGLFYSRSTARFFQVDLDSTYPCSRDSNTLEKSTAVVSRLDQSELKAESNAPLPNGANISDSLAVKALDLSKKEDLTSDQGTVILDLSLKNSASQVVTPDLQVNKKETSVSSELKETSNQLNTQSSKRPQEARPIQVCSEIMLSTKFINGMIDLGSFYKNMGACTPLQQATMLPCRNAALIPVQKAYQSVFLLPLQTAGNSYKMDMKPVSGSSKLTEISSGQPPREVMSKSITDDTKKEVGDVVLTVRCDDVESKDVKTLEVNKKPLQEDDKEPCPKAIQTHGDATNKVSVNLDENEKCGTSEGHKAPSQSKAVGVNEDRSTFTESAEQKDASAVKEDRFGETDTFVSPVNAKSDASEQPHSVTCHDPNSAKKEDIAKLDNQTKSDKLPAQAVKKEEPFHDIQMSEVCVDVGVLTAEHAITEEAPHTLPKLEAELKKPAIEEDVPQTDNSTETGSKNKAMTSISQRSDGHEDGESKSVIEEPMAGNQTQKETLIHQSDSSQREPVEPDTEIANTKDLTSDEENKGLGTSHSRIIIPFIGVDISGEDMLQPLDSPLQSNVDKSVPSQTAKAAVSGTTQPETVSKVSSAAQVHSVMAELSLGKTPLLGIPEINQLWASGSESDDRCPTPTMDEKPYGSSNSSDSQSCASPLSRSKSSKTVTQKCSRNSSITGHDEKPVEQNPSQASTVSDGLGTHHSLLPDLEERTLRVLQSINKYFPKISSSDTPSQIKTADLKEEPQTSDPHLRDTRNKKTSNTKSAAVSASTPHKLQTESSGNLLILPFKNKMEEVLGVGLQHKHTDSSVHQHYYERTEKSKQTSSELDVCHPHQSIPSTSCLGAMDLNNDQDRHTASQANSMYDSRPFSQRPIMAVKPSKSDESQADTLSKDRLSENSVVSHCPQNKWIKTSLVPSVNQTTKHLEIKKGNSKRLDISTQEACEHLSKSSWSHDSKSIKTTHSHQDPLYQYQEKDILKFKMALSSLPVQSFGSAKSFSHLVDGKQSLTNSSAEKIGQSAEESLKIDQRNCSEASTSHAGYEEDAMDESLYLGPDSSLSCTVYNTSRKRPYSFLEQVSQRCIQEDPTEASMDQECLIFSEKMKQLMKRCKMGSDCQRDAHGKSHLPCSNSMSIQFSCLGEQEETLDHIDDLSLFGQQIKVDMSDRKETTEKGKTPSQGAGMPIEHAGVSALTAECAELYEATMNNVCAIRDAPSKPKHIRTERSNQKAEQSNYFDFCDQMKKEMDESFRSSLNSVVKKSCKTKYRFYILETSEDAFFEETKAQLEAEGHTAVQPSEFLLNDATPSSLLIILRNEDIAEHICEVPHLLELKKCSGVQFAGIDEPDDVVNLTHQELFTRGGFLMFDRAALEPLNLCDMKKMSEILQELSKTGKWKWMLHYRDSRRIKENARLSAEAKEKKLFLDCCQDAGILEVLPYHECDLMSRDQPDYLTCLIRLQVQNITARYTVFITDSAADSAFERNGIVTMTISSFLTCSPSENFSV